MSESESESDEAGTPPVDSAAPNENQVTDASAEPSVTADRVADDVLLAGAEVARAALLEITPASTVGRPAGYLVEGERVLSLLFENTLPGYPGWYWTVSLSREEGSDRVNVLEAELMPGDGALLAPEWVPWADRLAEYQAQRKAEREAAAAAGQPDRDDDEGDELEDEDEDLDGEDFDDEESDDEESDDEESDDEESDDDLEIADLHDFDDEDEDFDESSELQGAEEAALTDED